jgi:hypothetical protein
LDRTEHILDIRCQRLSDAFRESVMQIKRIQLFRVERQSRGLNWEIKSKYLEEFLASKKDVAFDDGQQRSKQVEVFSQEVDRRWNQVEQRWCAWIDRLERGCVS